MFAMARKPDLNKAKPDPKPPVYYKSPMGSTYTTAQENKKPLPILVPQSSISVTKLSDTVRTQPSNMVDNRPALEIVRIPPTVPVVDKPIITPISSMAQRPANKTSRPPPATIPLIKIKKSAQQTTPNPVDLSGKVTHNGNANGHNNNSQPARSGDNNKDRHGDKLKLNMEMPAESRHKTDRKLELISSPTIGTSSAANSSDSLSSKICHVSSTSSSSSMPKLSDINKMRQANMRTQNSSVRMIPNPSALLAARNQSIQPIRTDSDTVSQSQNKSSLSPIGKKTIETVAAGLKANASTVNVV
jgi:hypothetical protein